MNKKYYNRISDIYTREEEIPMLCDIINVEDWDNVDDMDCWGMREQLVAEWYLGDKQ